MNTQQIKTDEFTQDFNTKLLEQNALACVNLINPLEILKRIKQLNEGIDYWTEEQLILLGVIGYWRMTEEQSYNIDQYLER